MNTMGSLCPLSLSTCILCRGCSVVPVVPSLSQELGAHGPFLLSLFQKGSSSVPIMPVCSVLVFVFSLRTGLPVAITNLNICGRY